jgi:hypothetical protein
VENVVSWNHIMDYEMNYQNVKGALRVYNEVSCCAQFNLTDGPNILGRAPKSSIYGEMLICGGYPR